MINNDQAALSIGLRVPRCALSVELNKFGKDHNVLELDDITTKSWARLDANLTSPDKLVVHPLGPRRLWDEVEAAYDWGYEQGKPDLARFGTTVTAGIQTVWLDEPSNVVRAFTLWVNQRQAQRAKTRGGQEVTDLFGTRGRELLGRLGLASAMPAKLNSALREPVMRTASQTRAAGQLGGPGAVANIG